MNATQQVPSEAMRLADGLLAETSKFGTPSIQRGLLNGAIQELRRLDAQAARLHGLVDRLRFALGDGERKLTDSQLARRAHELAQKAIKWDDWSDAQTRLDADMPEGWAFVIQCSPGDWDLYLTDADGERVQFDHDCETAAQAMNNAVDHARKAVGA